MIAIEKLEKELKEFEDSLTYKLIEMRLGYNYQYHDFIEVLHSLEIIEYLTAEYNRESMDVLWYPWGNWYVLEGKGKGTTKFLTLGRYYQSLAYEDNKIVTRNIKTTERLVLSPLLGKSGSVVNILIFLNSSDKREHLNQLIKAHRFNNEQEK